VCLEGTSRYCRCALPQVGRGSLTSPPIQPTHWNLRERVRVLVKGRVYVRVGEEEDEGEGKGRGLREN